MTQEEKDLLLKDICARLPYGVKASTKVGGNIKISIIGEDTIIGEDGDSYDISFITPYLFPLSSMTEEQRKEMEENCLKFHQSGVLMPTYKTFDVFNKHHIDFRGLIEQGLANDATGKNIY